MSYLEAFEALVKVVHELREKCPWDRKQTLDSLRPLTIEEVYELAEAIDKKDWQGIKEELGDLFLHLIFYARIAQEQQQFDLTAVLTFIREKLIARHPHVYGDLQLNDSEAVIANWERLKQKERKGSILQGVPKHLPPLLKAHRIQEKAANVGFDWSHADEVFDKILEELKELQAAKTPQQKEEELGDLLFAIVNYARHLGIDASQALERTNQKFIKRFQAMEKAAWEQGKTLSELSLEALETLWQASK